ncbi:hypothetical protein Q757_05955 [Oenococcus alcoholitolerans]|uniref:Uncharacterized protein n=1 Tax=Oenococcus alcoholitolerans TaxID=931074 RepID=A0ABR4XRF7_9LACO|nr:hypothetical protein Q757_05955 [Oenococcus alcoholitolerans]
MVFFLKKDNLQQNSDRAAANKSFLANQQAKVVLSSQRPFFDRILL